MKNIYVKPEETVVTNGTAQAPIPQVPIPKITYAQGGVPTVSGQPTNYGNLMGGGNTSVPPASTPSTTYAANGYGTDMSQATIPEYYKYAYETGVQNAERTRYNAVQNARVTYNQFINPYGAVANQQAQAGFTGGGYSQFLQGQAYQSMIDSQNMARATEAATKQTLYGDYLKGMADYNQKQQEKQEQRDATAADLLNNIGTYSSLEAVNSALDALGITDEKQRKTYTDAWQTSQTEKLNTEGANILNNIGSYTTEAGLIADLNAKGITGDAQAQYIKAWNTAQANKLTTAGATIMQSIDNGEFKSQDSLVAAMNAAGIPVEQQQSYITSWQEQNTKATEQTKAQNLLTFSNYVSGQGETSPTSVEDIYASAKALGLDVDSDEVKNAIANFNSSQYLSKVENVMSMEGSQAEDGWEDLLSDEEAFKSLTEEQQAEVNKAFSDWLINNAFTDAKGNVSAEGFFTDENGKAYTEEFARRKLQEELANPHYSQQLKDLIQAEFNNKYQGGKTDEQINKEASDLKQRNEIIANARNINNNVEIRDDANVVNINSSTYASSDFGKFNDTGKKDSEQEKYITAIFDDAKAGKIKKGQIILPNYGKDKGSREAYMYVGSGRFVKVEINKNNVEGLNFYTPNGYKTNAEYQVESKKSTFEKISGQ
jgi:hypothetical protein